jgi:hypothetical protein
MTWTNISNAAVAVGGIPSSATVTALRDNPGAMAEAATGAPVIFAGWHPVDKETVGDGKTGLIYDHAVNGTVSEIVTSDFEDGYEYRLLGERLSHNSGSSRGLRIQAYAETAGSYFTGFTTATVTASALVTFDAEFRLPRLARHAHILKVIAASSTISTLLDANRDGVFGVFLEDNGAEKLLRARITFSADSIDGGRVWMFRRREYVTGS